MSQSDRPEPDMCGFLVGGEDHFHAKVNKKMVPNWHDWPVTEQYIDFGRYPLHNENCFNQTTVPAACYWLYLHTRPGAGK